VEVSARPASVNGQDLGERLQDPVLNLEETEASVTLMPGSVVGI